MNKRKSSSSIRRDLYSESSITDLYVPLHMPKELKKAYITNYNTIIDVFCLKTNKENLTTLLVWLYW